MGYYRGYIKTVGRNLKAAIGRLGSRWSVVAQRLGSGWGGRLRGWRSGLAPLRLVALAITGLLVLVLGAYLTAPGPLSPTIPLDAGPAGSPPGAPAETQWADGAKAPQAGGATDEGPALPESGTDSGDTPAADPEDTPVEPQGGAAPAVAAKCRPAGGPVVRPFGWYFSPTLQEWRFHPGVDIGARTGTPVWSVAAGKVEAVTEGDYGLTVSVRLADGSIVLYAPCQDIVVGPGDQVVSGQQLATIGAAAGLEVADPPHLHLEISDRNGEVVDPRPYLP